MTVSQAIVLMEKIRFKKCMTAEDFCKSLGITYGTYMNTIHGHRKPSFVTKSKIVKFLESEGHVVELERD